MAARIIIKEVNSCGECPYIRRHHDYNRDWNNHSYCNISNTCIVCDDEEAEILKQQEIYDKVVEMGGKLYEDRPVNPLEVIHPDCPLPLKTNIIQK